MSLHYCSNCMEYTEVWKRDKSGKFFCYCINKSCNSRRDKKVLDNPTDCATMESSQPKLSVNEESMTFNEAKILIDEAHKCGYKGTEWEQAFLCRLESMQPMILRPEDALSVQEFYRRATGGGYRIQRTRYKSVEAEL